MGRCWRLFMIKLWNHALLDARTLNSCNIILEKCQNQASDPKDQKRKYFFPVLAVLGFGPWQSTTVIGNSGHCRQVVPNGTEQARRFGVGETICLSEENNYWVKKNSSGYKVTDLLISVPTFVTYGFCKMSFIKSLELNELLFILSSWHDLRVLSQMKFKNVPCSVLVSLHNPIPKERI